MPSLQSKEKVVTFDIRHVESVSTLLTCEIKSKWSHVMINHLSTMKNIYFLVLGTTGLFLRVICMLVSVSLVNIALIPILGIPTAQAQTCSPACTGTQTCVTDNTCVNQVPFGCSDTN